MPTAAPQKVKKVVQDLADAPSFIETQFPVSPLSKESYKERKAVSGQTLTGLGKWWGRKPLVLVRATILGLLLPSTDDPKKDREMFLKLMTMDLDGHLHRKDKGLPMKVIASLATDEEKAKYLRQEGGKWKWKPKLGKEKKEELDLAVFGRMGYDERMDNMRRPEQIEGPSAQAWKEINAHLGTKAKNLPELVEELGMRRFGHAPRVGDAFCGGGSIPFEAGRIGCDAYGSDLNPAAALLTWAALNIVGGGGEVQERVRKAQAAAFKKADAQITKWGIEHNEEGWRADAYLYCVEAKSPATGWWVPLAPSWVISEKYRVCGVLEPDPVNKRYHIRIVEDADDATFEKAKQGTAQDSDLICPENGKRFTITTIRGDRRIDGRTVYGLRQWDIEDIVPRPDDTYQERLYCIRYVEALREGQDDEELIRHYLEPSKGDLKREAMVVKLLKERLGKWQSEGIIPSALIPPGDKTDEPKYQRGWTYWHHLFNPRQLLSIGLVKEIGLEDCTDQQERVGVSLLAARMADWNSRLSVWLPAQSGGAGGGKNTFLNQALNTLFNYSARGIVALDSLLYECKYSPSIEQRTSVRTLDARLLTTDNDYWITDPPYADAVNYHELGDFFLAWYEKQLPKLFPDWYAESKAALAVKGTGQSFNQSMVACYSNFTKHMPANGAQVVMFTHQDASVWADLALILWASGLQVTAAWTIQTETPIGGIKKGNYVQGTVVMVLRKRITEQVGFLGDIQAEVELEVKKQLEQMLSLDDKDQPNFEDTDYQLAAYAAALRVLTGYGRIEEINVHDYLQRERRKGEVNELEKLIVSAVQVAMDHLVPQGLDSRLWRTLRPAERFYLKGVEVEQHGEYRSSVYQEMGRGFGLPDYKSLMETGKANETRLRTAIEFKNKEMGEEGFGATLLRKLLFAIRETQREEDPEKGRDYLHQALGPQAYWESRQDMLKLLTYLDQKCGHIAHWQEDVAALRLLKGYLENDRT
jgi:putative DNA methylase